jgi:gliding motility-associated-like protein
LKTLLKFGICLASLCLASLLPAQNQTAKWCFGQKAGLDFMTTPPTPFTSSIITQEGCSSVADVAGNLLFYTDGITVYNSLHNIMTNGSGLLGNSSSTQSGVIIKKPGSATIYYIFTTGLQNGSIYYSVVDMSLSGGLGAVTIQNTLLYTGSTEKLTAVRHCNGADMWAMTHDYNTNIYRCWLVTSAGINMTAVTSAVGTIHTGAVGHLRASPNGKKLAVGIYTAGKFELCDFNSSTGAVSNALVLASFSSPYGVEFSPDGTKVYCTREVSGNPIYQWDLCAGSDQAIIASQYTIATAPGALSMALQAGPDGKIYCAVYNANALGVINNPNVYGAGCNYMNGGQTIAPNTNRLGLPNFLTSYLSVPNFSYSQGGSCSGLSFTAPTIPAQGGCSAQSPIQGLTWVFGDPGSGAANTSTVTNPVHSYPAPGTYTAQLVVSTACGNDTATKVVTVLGPTVQAAISPTITQPTCNNLQNGFDLGLTFGNANPVPNYTVTWSTIPNGVLNNTQSSVVNGTIAPGPYSASVSLGDGCPPLVANFTIAPLNVPVAFNVAPVYTVNCFQPVVTVTLDPANTYTWTSLVSFPFNGNMAVLSNTSLGQWSVTGGNGACATTLTFNVVQDVALPNSTVTPGSQSISCGGNAAATMTAIINPSINVTHEWMAPQGGTLSAGSGVSYYAPSGPGTYTHIAINNIKGCRKLSTFLVTSNDVYPTFTLNSQQNFTLGCGTRSVATINIVNPGSQGGGVVSYTVIGVSTSSNYVLPPSGPAVYTVNAPGTWTAIVKDNASQCETKVQFSVIQNTFQPQITASMPTRTLSCFTPSVILLGSSTTSNVSFNWGFPGSPGNVANASVAVLVTANISASVIALYTLTVLDNNNTCTSTSVVTMYQNIRPPLAAIAGGSVISCSTGSVSLSNNSITGILPNTFFISQPLSAYLWEGPTPQQPLQLSSSYLAYVPGTYTMNVRDLNNGCTAVATKSIDDFRDYPVVSAPPAFTLDCGFPGVKITPVINDPNSKNFIYQWGVVPNSTVSGITSATLTTNLEGLYLITITNTLNGCVRKSYAEVISGSLMANFAMDPSEGYAPLSVNFANNSASSAGTSSITSIWSFGNGAVLTTTANITANTIYTSPGTYSVTLFTIKGACRDSSTKVIFVDIASRLEIPNVFTPNGDGSNDVFFLHVANLTDIKVEIFDRWGNKVFTQDSSTGNIAWDGKTPYDEEASDGTYFYVIRATGKDGQNYQQKGTISLIR